MFDPLINLFLLFAGFSIYMWIAFIAVSAFIIFLLDEGNGTDANWGGTTITVLVALAVLHFAYPPLSIWNYAIANPWGLVHDLTYYVVAGVIWAYVKWGFFVNKQYANWKSIFKSSTSFDLPSAMEYKAEIMGWLAFWPWSFVWTMLNDPIRKFFNTLFNLLSESFDSISRWRFRELIDAKAAEAAEAEAKRLEHMKLLESSNKKK